MTEPVEIPLSGLTALTGAKLLQQSDAAILITPAGRWHYSAEAAFELPGIEHGTCSINLSAQVETGKIGIGWLNAEGSDWVARAFIDRSAAPAQVRLDIPAGTRGGRLIVENASDDGRPSVAVLYHISISEAGQESGSDSQTANKTTDAH